MNINLSIIRGIIRKSLEESREEGCQDDMRRQRAIYHALKAMHLMCKDQPRSMHFEITGAEKGSELHTAIELMLQPEYKEVVRALPAMVDQEASE